MKKTLLKLKNVDNSILKVLYNGLKFCLILALLATFILSIYHTVHNPDIFYIGISLFKSTLFFIVFFIICAIAIDTIKKEVER